MDNSKPHKLFAIVSVVACAAILANLVTPLMYKFLVPDMNFHLANIGIGSLSFFTTLILILIFICLHFYSYQVKEIEKHFAKFNLNFLLFMIFFITLVSYFFIPTGGAPFIYFQF